MRAKSIYFVRLFLLIILVALFSSCKDDVVNPSSGASFAPPRFNWKIDTLEPTTGDMLILDSNNYFTISNYINFGELHHFKNGVRNDYSTGHFATSIDGFGENGIFIGGSKNIHDNFSSPSLTKFSNGNFTEISTGCDTAEYSCTTSIKIINNNVWGVTSRGEAFKYDGVHTTYYKVDTNYYSFLIANDVYNNVYIFMLQEVLDSLGIPKDLHIKVMQNKNNSWEKVYEVLNTSNYVEHFYKGFDNRIFCTKIKNYNEYIGTFDYTNGNFSLVFNENMYGVKGIIGGKSFNDLLIVCPSDEDYKRVYNWNGFTLSNETSNIFGRELLNLCQVIKITEIKNKYFVLFWDYGLTNKAFLLKSVK